MQYVLYHANCYDGFGAAWVAWQKFGDTAKYLPVSYGNPPPTLEDGSDVLIVDFSYPRAQLEELASRTQLQVLDHHQTAEAELAGLPYCLFDMERSGAMLAWDFLFPFTEAPRLVQYIQDRDLWRWALPYSQEVSAWLSGWPFDFRGWSRLSLDLVTRETEVYQQGAASLRMKRQYIESMCRDPLWVELGGHRVPAANATVAFSEVGERLCELFPDAPFAAYWSDRNDGKRQWGLRSRNGFDVSVVAQQYGGGGHKAAAGFTTPMTEVQP